MLFPGADIAGGKEPPEVIVDARPVNVRPDVVSCSGKVLVPQAVVYCGQDLLAEAGGYHQLLTDPLLRVCHPAVEDSSLKPQAVMLFPESHELPAVAPLLRRYAGPGG